MHIFIGPPTIQLPASSVQEERETGELPGASAGTYIGGASGKDQDNSSGVRSTRRKRKIANLNSEQGMYDRLCCRFCSKS